VWGESVREETQKTVLQWIKYDDSSGSLCEADDISTEYDSEKGPDAGKIGNIIVYEENKVTVNKRYLNILASSQGKHEENILHRWLEGLCVKQWCTSDISGHASNTVCLTVTELLQDSCLERHSLEMFPKLWIVLAGLNVDCGKYSDSGFGHCLKCLVLKDIDSKYTRKWT
ncbi:hypothetical protein Celaphus_00011554, partial [Cervus elaphus hippelaphus]